VVWVCRRFHHGRCQVLSWFVRSFRPLGTRPPAETITLIINKLMIWAGWETSIFHRWNGFAMQCSRWKSHQYDFSSVICIELSLFLAVGMPKSHLRCYRRLTAPYAVSLTSAKSAHNHDNSNARAALVGRWREPTWPPDRLDSGRFRSRTPLSHQDAVS